MAEEKLVQQRLAHASGKSEYIAPFVQRVVLVPEENVLVLCDGGSGTGDEDLPTCQTMCQSAT